MKIMNAKEYLLGQLKDYDSDRVLADVSFSSAEFERMKKLVKWIYQSETARWWMKYNINKEFPELVQMLNEADES